MPAGYAASFKSLRTPLSRITRRFYGPLMRRFLDDVSCIVATSPNYFATSDILSRYSEKVEVIPIGLDEDAYPRV